MNERNMKNVEINIGKICNNKCVFCVSGDDRIIDRRFVDSKLIKKELDFFYRKGCRSLGFLGGEPTVYPEIADIVKYAKKTGYKRIALTSNGMKFSDNDFCLALIKAGVNRFNISIHSHRAEIEDYLTRVPGNFNKKIKGIKNLMKLKKQGFLKDNVSLNAVVHKKNYKNLADMADFFGRLEVDDLRFNFIRPEGGALNDKSITPSYQSVKPYFYELIIANEIKYKINITFGETPFCVFKELHEKSPNLFNKYVGELHDLHTDVSSPSFFRKGSGKIVCSQEHFNWQDRKINNLKKKLPACRNCKFLNVCGGVWKTYLNIYKGTRIFKAIA